MAFFCITRKEIWNYEGTHCTGNFTEFKSHKFSELSSPAIVTDRQEQHNVSEEMPLLAGHEDNIDIMI